MLLRRRCIKIDVTSFLIAISATLFVSISLILYGTRTESPEIPSFIKQFLPAGRCLCQSSTTFQCDTCLDLAVASSPSDNDMKQDHGSWSFTYGRDDKNEGLNEHQCQVSFPGLFEDINLAVKARQRSLVTEDELSSFTLSKGMVRAMIYDGELYIIQAELVDQNNRKKALGTLHSIHRAMIAIPNRSSIPNIEFILSVEDLPRNPDKPLWVLTRRAQDENLWLMPDFGFWGWDVPEIGPISEVAEEVIERETVEPWEEKTKKLVWRGKLSFAPKLRRALLDVATGKSWSDVKSLLWAGGDFNELFLGPVDQCKYQFIAHAEGRSYSGALKYRQLCRSVVVSHKLQWIQHHHYLMKASGHHQNYVEVERDFSDLETKMEHLLTNPKEAKRIADNNVKTFRERYLTPAAEACYWRALFKGWKKVSFEPMLYDGEEQSGRLERKRKRGLRFETFALLDSDEQMAWTGTR